jgi:hypothetical protein
MGSDKKSEKKVKKQKPSALETFYEGDE